MITIFDGEWTVSRKDDSTLDGSAYNPNNKLVAFGAKRSTGTWLFDAISDPETFRKGIQELLDDTTLFVAHNAKADLSWLRECGFIYNGNIWDTMIFEYVTSMGMKRPLSLDACLERRGIEGKLDVLKDYFKKGYNTDEIPRDELMEYLQRDLEATWELYHIQDELTRSNDKVIYMMPCINMMNEFCSTLTNMERNGIAIDLNELEDVRVAYEKELAILQRRMDEIVGLTMGHTQVNLNSSSQLSAFIYSRKVKNKPEWKEIFNLGTEEKNSVIKKKYAKKYKDSTFRKLIQEGTTVVYQTRATKCKTCDGVGKIQKIKKDGNPYKNMSKCSDCFGKGLLYGDLPTIGGLKVRPLSSEHTAIAGFSTSATTLDELLEKANLSDIAREFLESLKRSNAIRTYLNTFIDGIARNMRLTGLIHTSFNQCITATGRLSSSNPNFQNMPRGNTFPVRKAIISRWAKDGGVLLDCDFGQLEFRVAATLSGDETALHDINNGLDVHAQTRDLINAAGGDINRQEAKAYTFLPLYGGGTAQHLPEYIKYYCTWFRKEKYPQIGMWQDELGAEVLRTKMMRSPSGRIYAFPFAKRTAFGSISGFQQICNYTVQGFATGDIVPIVIILLEKMMEKANVKSKLILTVHDSVTCDIYPGEFDIMGDIFKKAFDKVPEYVKLYFNYELKIPLDYDLEWGVNLMDKQAVTN